MTSPPPDHVRSAFGVPAEVAQPLSGGHGQAFRCGEIVLKRVARHDEASWGADVFERLTVPGVRLARPVRSTDGRWVVSGWAAHRFVAGRPAPRFDDIIRVGDALHAAIGDLPRPRFLDEREDVWSWADDYSWHDRGVDDVRLGEGVAADTFRRLAAGRRPLDLPAQIVHGDLTGNVLFAGSAPPAVIDMTFYWRPPSWATAIVVVDAIAWGGADLGLARRDSPHWEQVLRRALMCRLAVSLAHPHSSPASMVGVMSAVERLMPVIAGASTTV
jgi:uncharacterized protein (TIGR02569 family)